MEVIKISNKICSFAGHATLYDSEEIIKQKLKKEIINLIEKENVTTFYSGGKGRFDLLCGYTIGELKKDYPSIKSYLILPYPSIRKDTYSKGFIETFDNIIYPNLENIPIRFAILKRNEWIINNSDFLIAYVRHSWGGAYKTLKYAEKRKNIKIINIAKEV